MSVILAVAKVCLFMGLVFGSSKMVGILVNRKGK